MESKSVGESEGEARRMQAPETASTRSLGLFLPKPRRSLYRPGVTQSTTRGGFS
ncbi:unnamed protein product [Gulo gulo]|uniref:Uncharacterized protein n=1 Tax=Gulo gulo TaxID=48420 RepID=A0A9X9M0Z3_GULGU|nr:unnamed protein product [Gulo gulo]